MLFADIFQCRSVTVRHVRPYHVAVQRDGTIRAVLMHCKGKLTASALVLDYPKNSNWWPILMVHPYKVMEPWILLRPQSEGFFNERREGVRGVADLAESMELVRI